MLSYDAPGYEGPPQPLVLVCGPPRSGTTLAMQILVSQLDVGFVDHLIARFWRSPAAGVALRREVFGDDPDVSFESTLGNTPRPLDVHHFGYFWKRWFGCNRNGDSVRNARPAMLAHPFELSDLTAAWGKPVVMGGQYALRHFPVIGHDQVVIVRVKRDLIDNACSLALAQGRLDDMAFGIHPAGFGEHVDALFADEADLQSDGTWAYEQVRKLDHDFTIDLKGVAVAPPYPVITVDYNDMCAGPRRVLVERVREALDVMTDGGSRARPNAVALRSFPPSSHHNTELYNELYDYHRSRE